MGFPVGAMVKNPPANAGDMRDTGSIPGLGRCPGERNGNPLQYSCLENPIDRGTWWATQSMGSQRVRHDWSDLAVYSIDHVYLSIPVFQFILFPPLPHWCSYICSLPLCLYFWFLSQGCVFFWRLLGNVWPFVCPNFSRLPAFPGPHPSIIFKINSGWYYLLTYCHSNINFSASLFHI